MHLNNSCLPLGEKLRIDDSHYKDSQQVTLELTGHCKRIYRKMMLGFNDVTFHPFMSNRRAHKWSRATITFRFVVASTTTYLIWRLRERESTQLVLNCYKVVINLRNWHEERLAVKILRTRKATRNLY